MTHICVGKLTIISSDNGLSPGRRQAIIWTNARILLIRILGTNFSDILGVIHSFSFSKMHLKISSAKWRLFGLGLNELLSVWISNHMPSKEWGEIIFPFSNFNDPLSPQDIPYWTRNGGGGLNGATEITTRWLMWQLRPNRSATVTRRGLPVRVISATEILSVINL